MKIAAYNVENLFDRAKAFNEEDQEVSQGAITAASELNSLFEEPTYTAAHLTRMRELIIELGLERSDTGPFVLLRQIRGRMVSRPTNRPFALKASGRDDWVGWVELRTAHVNEIAIRIGAWPGSRPPRWTVYPELKREIHVASDHHLIWAEIRPQA